MCVCVFSCRCICLRRSSCCAPQTLDDASPQVARFAVAGTAMRLCSHSRRYTQVVQKASCSTVQMLLLKGAYVVVREQGIRDQGCIDGACQASCSCCSPSCFLAGPGSRLGWGFAGCTSWHSWPRAGLGLTCASQARHRCLMCHAGCVG